MAGLDAPEVPDVPDVSEGEAPAEGPSAAADDAWAVPPGRFSGPDGPSAAPTATSRQTAHLDDHTAGSPGSMGSASHGVSLPASRTGEKEITDRYGSTGDP
ncbi:hypothetical protein GCM10010498_02790 [Streptomyces cavourensis]|nr:hypothetical protein GCM10010498_02790 [Streptomyces cavourensis]